MGQESTTSSAQRAARGVAAAPETACRPARPAVMIAVMTALPTAPARPAAASALTTALTVARQQQDPGFGRFTGRR